MDEIQYVLMVDAMSVGPTARGVLQPVANQPAYRPDQTENLYTAHLPPSGINNLLDLIAAQMVLARAGMPRAEHALIFLPHWGLGIEAMRAGIEMGITTFDVDHKADIAQVAGFRGRIKPQEGHTTFVNGLGIFQVRPETCRA